MHWSAQPSCHIMLPIFEHSAASAGEGFRLHKSCCKDQYRRGDVGLNEGCCG